MRRGPAPGAVRTVDVVAIAEIAWGTPPDWVLALAREAARTNQRAVGRRIGYCDAVVSEVIRNKYRGAMERVEGAVRGALMGLRVECPVVGEIGRDTCLAHQKAKLSTASPVSVRLWHACRAGCRHACSTATTGGEA